MFRNYANKAGQFWRKVTIASNIIPSLRLVWKAAPVWTGVQTSLLILQGGFPLITLYATKLIIDTLTSQLGAQAIPQENIWFRLVGLMALLGTMLIFNNVLGILSGFAGTIQSQKFSDYMYGVLHAKSVEIDLEYYENPEYHDTLQRAQQEAVYRPNQLLDNLISVSQNFITLVVMGGLLLTLHWAIAAVVIVVALPGFWIKVRHADERYRWQRQRTSLERRSFYLSWLMIQDDFAKEVRLFNLGPVFSRRFDHLRQQLYREMVSIHKRFMFSRLLVQTVSVGLTTLAFSFVVFNVFKGVLTVGDLVLYYQALQRGQQAFHGITNDLSSLYEDKLFLDDLFEFLNLTPKIISPKFPKPVPCPMQQGFRFEGVDFQYEGTERQALQSIDFCIKPGEVIALVGENGSGKTTLIKLLCRLYRPSTGRITLDGIDVSEFDIATLRRQISVIFQDYAKYCMTAQENIWLGNADLSPNDSLIEKAAVKSGADVVIRSLPNKYDTMLGKLFADGEELSIGQWQKIALARAFLREAQLVVLDEPTSAMDPQAEYEVFQQFRELIQGKSAILISHRLSTVRMADRIYLMEKGRVLEVGSHKELIANQGRYAHLFNMQARNYR